MADTPSDQQVAALKDEGNQLYKAGKNSQAIEKYQEALKLGGSKCPEALALYKNTAACYIKLQKWKEAASSCDKALEINGGDVKALYRRAQAKEKLGEVEDAFADIVKVTKLDPKNASATEMARRLMVAASAKQEHRRSAAGRSQDILEMVISDPDESKRKQAAINLAALAQDESGAVSLFKRGAITKLEKMLDSKDIEVLSAILHAYGAIASKVPIRALAVLKFFSSEEVGKKLMALIQHKEKKVVRASIMILSIALETLTEEKVDAPEFKAGVNKILEYLILLLPHGSITSDARDAVLAAIVKNVERSDVGKRFVDLGGIRALLMTASFAKSPLAAELTSGGEGESTPGIDISTESRMQVSVALQRIWEATKVKTKGKTDPYERMIKDCIQSLKWTDDPVTNIPVVNVLTAIIQGVIELANQILDSEGVMKRIMAMAQSEHLEAQCVAAEALSHAASDKKRSKEVMTGGFATLKRLYAKDLPDAIRVRALTGLCKMGSHGGGTSNQKSFADGAVVNLAKKIRPFLISDDKTLDCRKWASEGLAYLSLDADVKEMIVGDRKILKIVKSLCEDGDPTVQYGLANMLVNVSNSYDMPENTEEREQMKQLGKFAGEHIPEPHELDAEEFAKKRTEILVKAGMATAMVHLAKSDSDRVREQVARVLLAMSTEPSHRGQVIAQGGARSLVSLANKNTDKGKAKASQALAKLAITADPAVAFPGQRAAELVRPLLQLTMSKKGLDKFEAGLALTNLAGSSEELRMKIYREDGLKYLDDLFFDDDWRIRRCGVECLCNLLYCDKVFEAYGTKEGKRWERIKMIILFSGCATDDFGAARAAAGCIALLSGSPDVCRKIREEKQGLSILKENIASGSSELAIRGLHTWRHMIGVDKDMAEHLTKDRGMELITAMYLTSDNDDVKSYCKQILEKWAELGVIESLEGAIQQTAARSGEILEELQRKEEEEEEEEEGESEDEEEEVDPKDFEWPNKDKAEEPKIEEVEDKPEKKDDEGKIDNKKEGDEAPRPVYADDGGEPASDENSEGYIEVGHDEVSEETASEEKN